MPYAAGVAHYHRLPAARSLFKTLLQHPIAKMLKRDVWAYSFLTSHSGKAIDPDLQELRKPWADPVRENIMAVSPREKIQKFHIPHPRLVMSLNGHLRYLNPTWQDGGLYYTPNDETMGEQGNWKTMDLFTGNSAIGYCTQD
ncbi:hypothetical protein N8T08_009668 [Aspergillus melleus]|uniref:Uncharacterized protein n=1 Tax=Aspergillus melleus TaxID=138277 RepID=A0ACC3AT67_9EURO|nr:hypothetical protein N8T08_009668 [Aspergillus melleus]